MHESSGYGKLQVHLPGCRLRDAAFTMSVLLNALGTWTVALVATMCTHAARRGVPGSARPIAGGAAGAARAPSPRASKPPGRSTCTRRAPRCPARRPDRPRTSASLDIRRVPPYMMQRVHSTYPCWHCTEAHMPAMRCWYGTLSAVRGPCEPFSSIWSGDANTC